MSYACPNAERQRPCYLCGQFGHSRGYCPNSERSPCFQTNSGGVLLLCGNSYGCAGNSLLSFSVWGAHRVKLGWGLPPVDSCQN